MTKKIEQLLSITQVAEILNLSERAVRKEGREGKIPSRRIGPNFVIPEAELNSLRGEQLGFPFDG
jgi:excisionase family DNA binding protein